MATSEGYVHSPCRRSHTPVEDRSSVRPSICPFDNFSCPLCYSDTVKDIFMKLGTNVNHHQTMCREQEPTLHLHFTEFCPFDFFSYKSRSTL